MLKIIIPIGAYDKPLLKKLTSFKPKTTFQNSYNIPEDQLEYYSSNDYYHRFSKNPNNIVYPFNGEINHERLHNTYKEFYGSSCNDSQKCNTCIKTKRITQLYKHQEYCGYYFNINCSNCNAYALLYGKDNWLSYSNDN